MKTTTRAQGTFQRTLLALLGVLLAVGCKTYVSVPVGAAGAELVQGDRVRIVTWSGERMEFELEGIRHDVLVGVDEEVAFRDIKVLEKRTVDETGTMILASLVLVPFVVVASGALLLASFST